MTSTATPALLNLSGALDAAAVTAAENAADAARAAGRLGGIWAEASLAAAMVIGHSLRLPLSDPALRATATDICAHIRDMRAACARLAVEFPELVG